MNVLLGYESMYGTCEKVAPAVADGHVVGGPTQAFSTTPDRRARRASNRPEEC
jgi:hypothetical protein